MQQNAASVAKSNEPASFTLGQRRRIATVYDFIARSLPTEGRDYRVLFSFTDAENPDRVAVKFEPYTKIGKLWCEYCSEMLKKVGKK